MRPDGWRVWRIAIAVVAAHQKDLICGSESLLAARGVGQVTPVVPGERGAGGITHSVHLVGKCTSFTLQSGSLAGIAVLNGLARVLCGVCSGGATFFPCARNRVMQSIRAELCEWATSFSECLPGVAGSSRAATRHQAEGAGRKKLWPLWLWR